MDVTGVDEHTGLGRSGAGVFGAFLDGNSTVGDERLSPECCCSLAVGAARVSSERSGGGWGAAGTGADGAATDGSASVAFGRAGPGGEGADKSAADEGLTRVVVNGDCASGPSPSLHHRERRSRRRSRAARRHFPRLRDLGDSDLQHPERRRARGLPRNRGLGAGNVDQEYLRSQWS